MVNNNHIKQGKNKIHHMNPKSLANLRPNRNGRPKKDQSLIELIRNKLGEICEYDSSGRTWLEALADAEMRMALKDTAARRDLLDRLIGKPAEQLELYGKNGREITLKVVYDDRNRDSSQAT